MNVTIRPSSKSKKRPKTYLNLILKYDKHFQYFLERLVKFIVINRLFSSVRIIEISATINNKLEVLLFIQRCDALNFEVSRNSFFEYLDIEKI